MSTIGNGHTLPMTGWPLAVAEEKPNLLSGIS